MRHKLTNYPRYQIDDKECREACRAYALKPRIKFDDEAREEYDYLMRVKK